MITLWEGWGETYEQRTDFIECKSLVTPLDIKFQVTF
jgi:hypothetical protein